MRPPLRLQQLSTDQKHSTWRAADDRNGHPCCLDGHQTPEQAARCAERKWGR